ncbi:MAG: ADP-forming succinate--CoA ligase subunit beta [Alphaproteobacteria bacterium]|nr:ADP-forming succinate--CoA ligase subunit beta [Alphaproteobacteria bacterium]
MNIHEYQAKKIISQYGINIPKGCIAYTPLEAKKAAAEISFRGPWMLKSQIQSGARNQGYFLEKKAGKKGGIRLVKSRREIVQEAEKMLGSTLVTVQTGPKGKSVGRIYVEAFKKVKKIFYTGLVIDRMIPAITLLIADAKDEEIVNLAISCPEKILRIQLDLLTGASPEQIQQILEFLKLKPQSAKSLETFVNGLHQAFVDYDAAMLEVNPAGVLPNGSIIALDAKLTIDDNALYRHKDISLLLDEYETEERELKASKYGFQYSSFDGSIGCIVNGDGIALAAMDLIRAKGSDTACFLNVKGGVDKDKIAAGIKIIMTNPRVEGILINIVGGFLRCNLIADGIISAASEVGLNVPLVVRFEGINKDEAKDILENSKLPIIIADEMEESVDKLLQAMEESD